MARFVYILTNGRAHDIRFVHDDYLSQKGEIEGEGDSLPNVDALSTTPEPAPPKSVSVADIVTVLSSEQRAAIQARIDARRQSGGI